MNDNLNNIINNDNSSNENIKKDKPTKTIDKIQLHSIKNKKPELIDDQITPSSYINQDYKYIKLSDESPINFSNNNKLYKKNDFSPNFDYPINNKGKKNELSLNLDNNNQSISGNDFDLDLKIEEIHNLNKNLINKHPDINIDQFNENRKIMSKKLSNEINAIKSPNIDNPSPYQYTHIENEKILKEIEDLNNEILNMKNEETKNTFKDRLTLIKSEGFDKLFPQLKEINENKNPLYKDSDLEYNVRFKNTSPNKRLNLLNLDEDEDFNTIERNDEDFKDKNSKLSPLGLIYPEKPRNSNQLIKEYKIKNGFETEPNDLNNYLTSNSNKSNLLRGKKNLTLKEDDDITKLRNIKLTSFKPNIDDDLMNTGNIGNNIIFPINEIPLSMTSPFNKLFIKIPSSEIDKNFNTLEIDDKDYVKKKIFNQNIIDTDSNK